MTGRHLTASLAAGLTLWAVAIGTFFTILGELT